MYLKRRFLFMFHGIQSLISTKTLVSLFASYTKSRDRVASMIFRVYTGHGLQGVVLGPYIANLSLLYRIISAYL